MHRADVSLQGKNYESRFILCVHQAVEWLSELLDALLKTHIRLGDDAQETKVLLEKHRKFVDVAQVQYLSSFLQGQCVNDFLQMMV